MEFLNETVQVMSFFCPKIGWPNWYQTEGLFSWLMCPTHQPMGSGLNLELLTPRWLEEDKEKSPK